ncbi:MAG TPA: UDP-glucose 4-epimerase GalE [Myxococcales bacterium]|nr:UDP-glucose 4-epimerase GalE [Myxococcales bacterium]
MRVLVTGGAGYIGSGVVEELIRSGHRAVVLDNLSKGHRDAVHPEAEFIEEDLLHADAVRLALHGVDAVVHMAADSLVGESVGNPAKYYRNNLVAGLVLLDAMRESGARHLVFSSTAAVYGEPAKQPIEERDPTAPTNPYGESKLAFEHALRWYGVYGLRAISLRYFNAAGATALCRERHDPETHLIPVVLQVALGTLPEVTVFGSDYPTPDGTCVRDYIHVSDLARAHVLALEALAGGNPGGAYNLGCGGKGYSVKQVIDVARAVTGREIAVRTGPRRPGDPPVLVASSQRISAELGWTPHLQDLREIVGSAWDSLRR